MFAALAPDYDRWNRLLSFGLDRRWRKKAVVPLVSCRLVCDLGAGTGDMTRALLRHRNFAGDVIALDPTPGLWIVALNSQLRNDPRCRFAVAEGEHLPLRDSSIDGLMSGFVMRNFFDLDLALRESARVVRSGGCAVFLEMGHPKNTAWAALFRWYFQRLAPFVAGLFARNTRAYQYLPASLARFPRQHELRERFLQNGWRACEYKEYLGGAVVAYKATK
jgi:demethylmenaquinone methyltransferase/2-methoxy-6-polyprenyl-1,4-benzoquinol methylase